MKKTFFKNLFRDIIKTLSRFLSILIIIAVGVAFYAGVRATSPDMKMSADQYFNNNNLMDFKLISTLGLTKEDINAVSKVKGVTSVEGAYSLDAVIEKNKRSLVLNVDSLPGENGINKLKLVSGRRAKNDNEIVAEERFLQENGLKVGETITLKSGNDSKLEDSLKNTEFKIVGAAESPLYVSAQRQLSPVGNGAVKGFVYIMPEVFKSEAYTEIYVRAKNSDSDKSILHNSDYNSRVDNIEKELKELGVVRVEQRYEELMKQAAKGNQVQQQAQTIKKPEWYVLGRSTNMGYESYRLDSDRIDSIGKAFPLIFFLVAALVSLTTMTRMVQENRIEIGTFKALGYSRLAIVSHYLIYSFTASVVGSIIGIFFGFKLLPPFIMNAYGTLYKIPDSVYSIDVRIALEAVLIAVLFTTIASVVATLEELREEPASLLRPKPPKSGDKILLERLTFLWKRLSFTRKVTARNIFRYKQRFFMTVIGIGACTGLMITGFALKAGISGSTETQFNTIYKYDMTATLTKNIPVAEKEELKSKIVKQDNIKSIMFVYSKNGSVKKDNNTSEDAYVLVPENNSMLNDYVKLSSKGKAISLTDDGVILTEKFSKLINKKVGDSFEISLNDKVIKVKVAAVTEQYIQHYVYMSPKYYESVTGEPVSYNNIYSLLKSIEETTEENTSKDLKTINGINSVSFKNNTYADFNKSVYSINSVVLLLIASAGLLAFVVIFNLTNININERKRELATIKLLGFFNNELAFYIYRENIILTLIGSIAGIFIGIGLSNFVILTAETNIMMFKRGINPIYFLISIVLTILFSVIVNLAMYNRFDKIDMIESLKSAE